MKTKREALAKEYITEALWILMDKKDYKDITITEICEKAGVTRMSFYRNFETKEDVLKHYIVANTDIAANTVGTIGDLEFNFNNFRDRENFIKLFTLMAQHKKICVALYEADLLGIMKEQLDREFLNRRIDGYDSYKNSFNCGGIFSVFMEWVKNGEKESPEELADRLGEFLAD